MKLLTRSAFVRCAVAGCAVLAFAAFVAPRAALAQPQQVPSKPQIPTNKARVEIAFVLDTTGSMGGLIEGAKAKIWSIVNEIASAKPTPNIKIGFVAYRDKGDDYVTQVHDLNNDLDKAFATLQTFRAQGGGDTPEHVSKGLSDGVRGLSWSRAATDASVYQVIFLVGDCPPHTDYKDGYDYRAATKLGAEKGIVINAIRCGNDAQTEPVWKEIAKLGDGAYFSIAQSGGMTSIPSPYDAEMGKLADKLEGSTLAYGARGAAMARVSSRANSSLSATSKADRAEFNAKSAQAYGAFDLPTQYVNKTLSREKLAKLKIEELPAEMQKLAPAEREKYLQNKLVERKAAQVKLAGLQKKRDAYVQAEMKKRNATDKDSFDVLVKRTIKTQAARRGLRFAN